MSFGLVEALFGRRSRRFFYGAEIPDGPFAFRSRHDPVPLSELEKLLVLGACSSNTGWHHMVFRGARYAPHLSNYAGAAGGRTFPSSAGFHTSQIFFTDDDGVYFLDTRNAPSLSERDGTGRLSIEDLLGQLEMRIARLHEGRLHLPPEVPYVEPHNTWVANQPGTLLVIPIGDLAQHMLLNLCYMLQNGLVVFDDINRRAVPGIEKFGHLTDRDRSWPLTFVEQLTMAEATVELSTSCYAGVLMLQAMGLGGWMFDGIDPFAVLGAGGVPGLGFRYDSDARWPYPNPTGLAGVMEGFCPPHCPDMRAAVEAVCARKYGPGGPYNPETPGPWKDSRHVRASAQVHSEEFRACVALQAEYIHRTFGKFPATVPSMFVIMYLQAQHLDPEFYDTFFKPGAYLRTHAMHMGEWHGEADTR